MGRRKKGRDITGWLIVDKPAGPTSAAVVNKARWLLQARKAGHAGTLDPAATGLLVIALGEATKVLPYITDALKAYRFTVRWGAATSTDDAEGPVIGTSEVRPDAAAIRAALPGFTGEIMQVPPAFSAVHVDGQRAHDLAREGATPELAARPLWVEKLTLLERSDADHAEFEMVCGKGGYVRAIARDLGRDLGCLGHVTQLRRSWSGPFDVADALPWHEDIAADLLEAAILPLGAGLGDLPECRCAAEARGRLANGNPVEVIWTEAENGTPAWASVQGAPLALGTYKFGHFHPSRVFNLDPAAAR